MASVIPDGMHDVLPLEAAELQGLEAIVRDRFRTFGYAEVRTPALEFAATVEAAGDDVLDAGLRLTDGGGGLLMLRSDLTVATTRLAASRLREQPLPLRLAYVGDAFRPVAPRRGEDGQVAQAGAELLGLDSPQADAESVILLCDTLAAIGLTGYRITIGTVAFHRGLVAALDLTDDDADDVFDALSARDYPLLESIAANSELGDEGRLALQRALELSGGDDALAEARRLATTGGMETAVDRLVRVRDLVAEAGFGDRVGFDFGLFLDLAYYTGMVVEAYVPGVSLPVASGGRYDDLPAAFGWQVPAVGFALSLDRLHVAAVEQGLEPATVGPALSFIGGLDDVERAAELRRAGLAVAALPATGVDAPPPSLRREDGEWVVTAVDGAVTRGPWRDALRALGVA